VEPLSVRGHDRNGHPYEIRDYVPADRARVEVMYADFEPKRAAQGLPPAQPLLRTRWLDRVLGGGRHLVVLVDDELLGHAMLLDMEPGRVEFANFLHQSIRHRGIGSALARLAVRLASEMGYRSIWLCVEPGNRPAVRSYERAGFRRVASMIWDPEIEMEYEIPAAGEAPAREPGTA
jgi:RimJ/RimL family protein N-acetyltransferase